jgi:hypothetical protein
MSDSLSLAFRVLLERLSPEQRAVFLLREVFDYGYDAIAKLVGKSEGSLRQLASRARGNVKQCRRRFQTTRKQCDELARLFFAAADGDLAGLEVLLAQDVELTSDGGGEASALARTLHGAPSKIYQHGHRVPPGPPRSRLGGCHSLTDLPGRAGREPPSTDPATQPRS